MRGAVPVSSYKFIVLGLIFLKYISDSFEEKYQELVEEGYGLEEDRDSYIAENIFYVPAKARWEYLNVHSKDSNIGEIIDTYDMTQSIIDGSTVPIMYESRMARVGLNQKLLDEIDEYYQYLESEEGIEEYKIDASKKKMATIKPIIENPDRLQIIVEDIIKHYEEIETTVANKAMVVAYSRQSAYTMYNKFLELRPNWKNKVNMIITSNNKDDEQMQKAIGSKKDKKQLEVDFKDMDSEFKIAIVVDMWLTGFDIPGLGTMYIDKPMKAHNLMQAIARVNRVYKEKTGGLIVDYIGLKRWLLDTLKTYTKRDQSKIVDNSEIVKILMDKVELTRDLFKNFYYSHFGSTTDSDKYKIIMAGSNWILKTEETKKAFMRYSYDIKSLYSLCTGALSQEIKDDEILQIGEIHNSNRLALLSDEILNKLAKMKKKNIAIEILNRALKEYVEQVGKENVILMEKFSTKFQKIVATYNERTSVEDLEKIIQEMINLKNEIEQELKAGNEYNLSSEEKAFFDALRR